MARKPLLGLIRCTECGFEAAEVRADKNGRAYFWCPDCSIQVFARTPEQDARIRARMRAVAPETAPETAPVPAPEPQPEPDTQPAPAQARRVGLLLE